VSTAPSERLVVVALCERLASAVAVQRRLGDMPGVELRALVCRNGRPLRRFAAGSALAALRAPEALGHLRRGSWRITPGHLDDARTLAILRRWSPDVGLHGMSVIYRRPAIEAFRLGILNPHIGLLPEYRGRSVMEWSVLRGDPTGITAFYVDEGIDTGPIVWREEVPLPPGAGVAPAKAFLFGRNLDVFERALAELLRPGFEPARQRVDEGTRYYVMSSLFTGVVERLLTSP
jgi:methionyl-tRNA formyltransferase